MHLSGKVALITGASKGIGAAIAHDLHRQGAQLGLVSRSGDDLGIGDAVAASCDVRALSQLEEAVAEVIERFGHLDILIVNAGVGSWGPLAVTPVQELEEIIDVNVKGALWSIRAALPHLREAPEADLVCVASIAGRRAVPGEAAYVASKFAQVGLVRALDHELREDGIRCTSICPGGVATQFGMGRGLRYPGMPELDDMLEAEDVAAAVRFVLTRPHSHRVMEVTMRHMSESSWG